MFVTYARIANRVRIDIATMLWADDEKSEARLEVANIARFAQANISAWDESNAYANAKAKSEKNKRGRRRR